MSDLPNKLDKQESEEEVGASHSEVKGTWRIVRTGVILAVVALAAVFFFYL